jgi:hypothetical protein
MISAIADTLTALWYLYDDRRLSAAAGDFIDQAGVRAGQIVVSSISLAELADPEQVFSETPFTTDVGDAMRQVARAGVPDMPDRTVAAAGLYFGVPVISRDGRIRGF